MTITIERCLSRLVDAQLDVHGATVAQLEALPSVSRAQEHYGGWCYVWVAPAKGDPIDNAGDSDT